MSTNEWSFTCPACQSTKFQYRSDTTACRECGRVVNQVSGVWQCLDHEQQQKYAAFLDTYTRVRIEEGRSSYDPETLRALPACKSSQAMAGQWKIRARSFTALKRLLERRAPTTAKILDLGAGNGWLCNRLFEAGYKPCAVDLSVDEQDGLGAAKNFKSAWPCIQAEFDRLPIEKNQADVIIYNASVHYCVDRQQTLREALRVLVPGGLLIIVDSPIYRDHDSGEQMLREQQDYFEALIGERSDSLDSTGFLTWDLLASIGHELGLHWKIDTPWYGVRWALRPFKARLRGSREPATFAILSAIAP